MQVPPASCAGRLKVLLGANGYGTLRLVLGAARRGGPWRSRPRSRALRRTARHTSGSERQPVADSGGARPPRPSWCTFGAHVGETCLELVEDGRRLLGQVRCCGWADCPRSRARFHEVVIGGGQTRQDQTVVVPQPFPLRIGPTTHPVRLRRRVLELLLHQQRLRLRQGQDKRVTQDVAQGVERKQRA